MNYVSIIMGQTVSYQMFSIIRLDVCNASKMNQYFIFVVHDILSLRFSFYYERSIISRYCDISWLFHLIQDWVSISNVTLSMLFQVILYFFNSELWFFYCGYY